ncbi:mechanosensitive ion channel family protein [Limnofasciculus baicalensis]|uniref:Mechanosensitive ion channel family protein n=1 Tax=Limnofasciculus baicalensis BBK-W-15 TaxID=2699891 RepID=A0AAE3KSD5_9CYAN|nr:mechanosensitive ion channel family protein [Limnofasciculus baicalensis]MCP2729362.1 mechanosensitive ion channel family protein [Limnofasciculus baicalensis BBK-W-15]
MNISNNILIIGGEIGIILLGLLIINWLSYIGLKLISKAAWIKGHSDRILSIYRFIRRCLIGIGFLSCLSVIGVNGILIYQGKNLSQVHLELLRRIPIQFWVTLATALLKSVSLFMIVKLSLPSLNRGLDKICDPLVKLEQLSEYQEDVHSAFKRVKNILNNSIWLGTAILAISFFQVSAIIIEYLFIGLQVYLTVAFGLVFVGISSVSIDILNTIILNYATAKDKLTLYHRFSHLWPVFKKCLNGVIYIAIVALLAQEIKLAWLTNYSNKIISIVAILLISSLIIEVVEIVLEELLIGDKNLTEFQKKRRLTLHPLLRNSLKYFVYFSVGVAILKIFGIDPTAILAGAGIVGIAVGLGAQNLINDIVCGFLILFENYYLVGDYIKFSGTDEESLEGIVEAIELRTTQLRHPDGQLQIVRNGNINSIINYSKEYVYAKVEISIPYDSNLDMIYEMLEKVGKQLKMESPDILEVTQVDGLEEFGKTSLLIRTITKVKPGKHIELQRLLRRMFKETFDAQKIRIASDDDD